MGNYYYLAASLPPLSLREKPAITFEELEFRLEMNLSKHDFAKTVVFRRLIDLFNLRAFFAKHPLDSRGNLDEKEIDEALLFREGFPEYVYDYLDRYETAADRVLHFSQLLTNFFTEEIKKQKKGFLKAYLTFEREWRLVMVGIRSKLMGRSAAHELQFEELSEPIVAQILAQRDASDYDPPAEYADLKEVFLSCGADPLMQHHAVGRYRFDKIEELASYPLFSIDWILSYMAQLLIIEHWSELSHQKGEQFLQTLKA
jgi:hypothetical protein